MVLFTCSVVFVGFDGYIIFLNILHTTYFWLLGWIFPQGFQVFYVVCPGFPRVFSSVLGLS